MCVVAVLSDKSDGSVFAESVMTLQGRVTLGTPLLHEHTLCSELKCIAIRAALGNKWCMEQCLFKRRPSGLLIMIMAFLA